MKVAGLSIGRSEARAVFVNRALGPTRRIGSGEAALPEGGRECAALSEALRQWKDSYGIKGVVLGLDPSNFSMHFVDLPVKGRQDIQSALAFEMESHLPLPPEEYVIDHATVKSGPGGTRNLVLALRKETARRLADCVREAGLKLLGIRCTGVEALSEFVARGEAPAEAALVYRGEDRLYVAEVKGSAPVSLRSARTEEEARAEIEGIAGGPGVFLAQGGSLDGLQAKPLSYSMPEILATGGRRRPLGLDFAPPELSGPRPDYYNYSLVGLCALAVVLFLSTTFLGYYKERAALGDVNSRIAEIQSTARELMETQKELEAASERRRYLLEFQRRRNRHIEVLRELSTLLPEGAWLTNFSSDDKGKVEIQGHADRTAGIIGPLENSSLFKNVEFSSPVIVRGGKERFSIKMEIER